MAKADVTVKRFDYTMSGAPQLGTGAAGAFITWLDILCAGFGSVTASSVVVASDVCTVTVSSGHGFTMVGNNGPVIEMSGATTPTELNTQWRISGVTSSTVFTFVTVGIADQTATGTIAVKIAPLNMSKPYSGTNIAAYQFNGTGNQSVYRIDDTVAGYNVCPRGSLYESMSDINTGVNGSTQALFTLKYYNYTNPYWYVIADDNSAYFMIKHYYEGAYYSTGFLGKISTPLGSADAFNSVYMGWPLSTINSTAGTYIQRSYTGSGNVVTGSRTWPTVNIAYPDPAYGAVMAPVMVVEGTPTAPDYTSAAYRGLMPGMYRGLHLTASPNAGDTHEFGGRTYIYIREYAQSFWFDITGPWS